VSSSSDNNDSVSIMDCDDLVADPTDGVLDNVEDDVEGGSGGVVGDGDGWIGCRLFL